MRTLQTFITMLLTAGTALAQKETVFYERVMGSSIEMFDIKTVRTSGWDSLYRVPEHPAFDMMLTDSVEKSILSEINSRKEEIGDTLRTADLFYIWKPYFEWMRYIDPHYGMTSVIPTSIPYSELKNDSRALAKEREYQSDCLAETARILPLHGLYINDTLVVTASNVSEILPGDIIVSVNGIPFRKIMDYSIHTRHVQPYMSLLNYYYHGFDPVYSVEYERNGKREKMDIQGQDRIYIQRNTLFDKEEQPLSRYFEDARTGYIRIRQFFPDNSRLIKNLRKDIIGYKKQGCRNVIIDLRNNPGGNGSYFDRLLGIFIDKDEIQISKGEKLKVSDRTMKDYDFITEDMKGEVVDIPEKYIWKTVPLNTKYHIPDIRYYVLMDQGTMSTAALLCNILQYHSAATLVGEPLLRNSFKYGEVLDGRHLPESMGWLKENCISTNESDLYTKAVDGVLMPDIHIPYVARDYMTGKDAMLEKLLEKIKVQN